MTATRTIFNPALTNPTPNSLSSERSRRAEAKAASAEAAFQSALAALANPLEAAPAAARPMFRAFQLVAQTSGITLGRPVTHTAQTPEAIAHACRVRLRRVQLHGDWWNGDLGPLLGQRDGRPVALLPSGNGRYRVIDPVSTRSEVVTKPIASQIDPVAYILYGSLGSHAGFLQLAREGLRGSRGDVARVLACSAMAGILGLAPPLLLAWFAGSVIPAGDRAQLMTMVIGLVVAAICAALFNLSAALAVQRISTRSSGKAMAAVWNRVLALPVWFFRQFHSADLALRALSVDRAREAIGAVFLSGGVSFVFSGFHAFLLARLAPSLAFPALAFAAAMAIISAVCGHLFLGRQTRLGECEADTAGRTLELIHGIAKLRLAGAERHAFATWSHLYARGRREAIGVRNLSVVVSTLQAATPLAGWTLIAAIACGDPALRTHPAFLLAFSASFQQLLAGMLQLGGIFQTWAQITALAARAKPLLECPVETGDAGVVPQTLRGEVEVRGLSFQYDGAAAHVLYDVSFRIEPGEFVAFVGCSGSGKSTLLRMLLGFERPNAGSVLYDGCDLASFDHQALRRQFGVVLQNGRLLPDSIGSNILGATALGSEAAWRAAEVAGIAEEIRQMPMQMHTRIAENGCGLSGGQRQRILLARALVHQPRILLLDEATSALDNRTQARVTAELARLGATRIVIAHRLSTIRHADRIFVLDGGRIVESGNYAELWKRNGRFRELARPGAMSSEF